MKRQSPAAGRNAGPIGEALAHMLPCAGLVLEVASGSGEHALHFARVFPTLIWQPSDPDPEALASIAAWHEEAALSNLLVPVALDTASGNWPIDEADGVVCINMVHISPWAATLGLFAGAAKLLAPGAPLVLYGPYRRAGVATAASNEEFDASLKARDARWGLRDVETVAALHPALPLVELVEMPANNLMLLFRRAA